MSFYKYISKRLYDQSFILCTQIINNMKIIEVLAPPPPPCRLQCLTIRRILTCNCKVFTACKNDRNIFEVLFNCTHIYNDIAN